MAGEGGDATHHPGDFMTMSNPTAAPETPQVYVLIDKTPTGFPHQQIVAVYTDLAKALDKRRTKRRTNVDWRQEKDGTWTTLSPDYTYRLYPHYAVVPADLI